MHTRDGFRPQRAAIAASTYPEGFFRFCQVQMPLCRGVNVARTPDFIGRNGFLQNFSRVLNLDVARYWELLARIIPSHGVATYWVLRPKYDIIQTI